MGLATYKKKRKFTETPEPEGKQVSGNGMLRFVVQKHHARQLHYDFRLEMEGVMKSWAVPKGPSLDPKDKRLAMMVEDHPLEYRKFEGVIPEGNYGAGPVIIWDEGSYTSLNTANKKEAEKELLAGLHKGHITFILSGKKLKGEFALIKLRSGDKKAWLLVKADDQYTSKKNVTKQDKSVKSKKTIEQVEKSS